MTALGIDATTVVYFLAGALGSFLFVWRSEEVSAWGKRHVTETILGGVTGIVLPYFGSALSAMVGIPPEKLAAFPVIVKAALITLAAASQSFGSSRLFVSPSKP